jgi:hypothetical protein
VSVSDEQGRRGEEDCSGDEERRVLSPAALKAQQALERERRFGLWAQLGVNLVGVGLLVYAFRSYGEIAERLGPQGRRVVFVPIAIAAGLIYFSIRLLVVMRQLRKRR